MTSEEQAEDERRAEHQRQRCLAAIAGFLDELRFYVGKEREQVGCIATVLTGKEQARLMTLAQYVLTYELLPPERVHSLCREFGGFGSSHSDEQNFEKIYDELKDIAK